MDSIWLWVVGGALAGVAGVEFYSRTRKRYKRPVNGPVSSPYGWRIHPLTGEGAMHNGTDYAVPIGAPVLAPADGTVVDTYNTSAGGLQMIVDHADGLRTGYAHLNDVLYGPGDKVTKGQQIAVAGSSGNVTGPHLHFTAKHNGEYIDPEILFRVHV